MEIDSQTRGRGQNKHYWTVEEDEALIDALVELSANSMWRAENGFRNGYVLQLEKMMKEKIPTTTLKVVPNIESRVKLFRGKITAIVDILQISGFVWNNERSTVECEKSAYDEYVKNHKEAAGLYGKSFPFFNRLAPVFARDRAHGNARGDIGDDAEQYLNENITLDDDTPLFQMADDENISTQQPTQAPSPMESDTGTSRALARGKRKSLVDPSMDKISQHFLTFVEMVGPGFKALAESTAREADRDKAREERKKILGRVIFDVEGLSDDEAMFMLQFLSKDDDQLQIFLDLPDDKKLRFCRVILSRSIFVPTDM